MSSPLLATKFHIPPPRVDLVPRPHLLAQLNKGLEGRLVLVSAPAGFGKTTLVANWIRHEQLGDRDGRIAWLALDEDDNEFSRFFGYFIAAIQQIEPTLGKELVAALGSSQNLQPEILLTLLINEIAAVKDKFVLVIDDFHVISLLAIHQAVQFIIEHQPPTLLLVITSRDEPFLPLSRLRARRQMIDLRAGDLRFSHDEATHYLNQIMGLGLSEAEVQALATRTEGWVTGLHLAAVSMQEQNDPQQFIAEFTGDDRYIIDYLVDEVLSHRPEQSRDFMMRTSILGQLCGSLCEAVTEQADAQETLQHLEQENVFIIPLDNRRAWYRYHHLFGDVLRQRLAESMPRGEIKKLHHRASQWFAQNDLLIDAVEHALKAEQYEEAIALMETGAEELILNSQVNTLLKWCSQIPGSVIDSHPRLCLIFAWAWASTNHPEEAERCLQAVELSQGARLDELMAQAAGDANIGRIARGVLLETAVVRSQLAIARRNISETLRLTGYVLPQLEKEDVAYLFNPPIASRMAAHLTQGLAHKLSGHLVQALESFIQANRLGQQLGHVHIVALSYGHMANVYAIQGKLHQALKTCELGLHQVAFMAGDNSPLSGFLRAEYGVLQYERNDLENATHTLEEAVRVAKPWGYLDAFVPGLTGLMRVHLARGDWPAAEAALDELATLGRTNPQLVDPIVASHRALLWCCQGKLDAAGRWAENAQLDEGNEFDHAREKENIFLAQALVDLEKWPEAADLIERLLAIVSSSNRRGRMIKLLTLQAIVFQAGGRQAEAIESFERAISLASPEGYVRTVIDCGQPVKKLLKMALQREYSYAQELWSALDSPSESESPHPTAGLVEPLSEREMQVLCLLATELSGPEIAQELVIALSTLRSHTQQIYRKLGVNNRRSALRVADELHLL